MCKIGKATWAYNGVCRDPAVFGRMLKLDGPPTFKAKNFPVDEFQDKIGHIDMSARCVVLAFRSVHLCSLYISHLVDCRYSGLYILDSVLIQWKADAGTFKFSGTYGVSQS